MTETTSPADPGIHELVLHDGTPQLVDLMVPFLREGAAAGDRAVVLGEPWFVSALLDAVPQVRTLSVLTEHGDDRVPARDLHRFERMLAPLDRTSGVRVVNQMPAMTAARWPEWRRYEAAVNVVLSPYRVWGTCGYDTRALAAGMEADLRANHPSVRGHDGRLPSAEFDLDDRVPGYLDVPPHPVEHTEPTLVMPHATPTLARRAVQELAMRSGLPSTLRESVVLATNEAVSNAALHGRPPVLMRVWVTDTGRLTVAVSDAGPGPHPLVGLVPEAGSRGGGMWLVHLLLPEVHHRAGPEGYTVTFTADDATTLPDLGPRRTA